MAAAILKKKVYVGSNTQLRFKKKINNNFTLLDHNIHKRSDKMCCELQNLIIVCEKSAWTKPYKREELKKPFAQINIQEPRFKKTAEHLFARYWSMRVKKSKKEVIYWSNHDCHSFSRANLTWGRFQAIKSEEEQLDRRKSGNNLDFLIEIVIEIVERSNKKRTT